jgi:hypothetical protein
MPTRILNGTPMRFSAFARNNGPADFGRRSGRIQRGPVIAGAIYRLDPFNAALGRRIGKGKLGGSVKVKGTPDTPVSRPVVAFDHASLRPLAYTVSAADGSYTFIGLPSSPVFVVSFDSTGVHRAAIADNLMPEVLP